VAQQHVLRGVGNGVRHPACHLEKNQRGHPGAFVPTHAADRHRRLETEQGVDESVTKGSPYHAMLAEALYA